MKIKPNCYKCYYGGCFDPKERLASCKCEEITEPTIIEFNKVLNQELQYVKRDEWEDIHECDHFIPVLSETSGDIELEQVCSFETFFACPFCGDTMWVCDIGIEETKFVECESCERTIAVKGKSV